MLFAALNEIRRNISVENHSTKSEWKKNLLLIRLFDKKKIEKKNAEQNWIYSRHLRLSAIPFPCTRVSLQHWWCLTIDEGSAEYYCASVHKHLHKESKKDRLKERSERERKTQKMNSFYNYHWRCRHKVHSFQEIHLPCSMHNRFQLFDYLHKCQF